MLDKPVNQSRDDLVLHTPYDGTKKPFTIGMDALDPREWMEVDTNLCFYVEEKERVFSTLYKETVLEEPDTREAQQEVLDMLVDYLPQRFPDTYRVEGGEMHVVPAGRTFPIQNADEPPLLTAARFVQEDLILMRSTSEGVRMVAAAVAFPSSWYVPDKFGKNLAGIHENVPGFQGKMHDRVARIFENLPVEKPAMRLNWSLHQDDEMYQGHIKNFREEWFERVKPSPAAIFVRTERQTLRRLPKTSDVLFTIKVFMDPVSAFKTHPRGKELALGLHDQLMGLDADQLVYKNLTTARDQLCETLREVAAET